MENFEDTKIYIYLLLAGLSLLWIVVGIYLGRKSKDLESFVLCNRNVGLALGSATAVATWITSNTTLLAPQFAIQLGVWGMIAYSTASFGLLLFAPLAKRIRLLLPDGFTSGDFVRMRYGWFVWAIFILISIFYAVTWLISMGMAGGLLLKAIAGVPYFIGMSAILGTCVVYTLFGGMRAVIGTDFVQTVVILVGVTFLGFTILQRFDLIQVYDGVSENRPALVWVMLPAAIMSVFNNLLFGVGEIFHSNVWWSRAFAIREGLGKWCYFLAGIIWLPVPIAAGFIALSADVLGVNITSADMVGPLVAVKLLGQTGTILIFVIVYCSLASSIDSLLAATSDLVANDIYRKLFNPSASHQQVRRAIPYIILSIGFTAWIICSFNNSTLAEVLFFAGPMVGSIIWPILAGLYWKRATSLGAALGMILGSVIGLIAYFQIGWFVASLVGTFVSMIVVILSALVNKHPFNWNLVGPTSQRAEVK